MFIAQTELGSSASQPEFNPVSQHTRAVAEDQVAHEVYFDESEPSPEPDEQAEDSEVEDDSLEAYCFDDMSYDIRTYPDEEDGDEDEEEDEESMEEAAKVESGGDPADKKQRSGKKKLRKFIRRIFAKMKKQWFLEALLLGVLLAWLKPSFGNKDSWIHPSVTNKVLIFGIFFVSGLTLRTRELRKTFKSVKIHMFVQLFNLGLMPSLVFALTTILKKTTNMDHRLLTGLMTLMCWPTTISSNVILTQSAGGNEAAALFNAVFGNLLGLVISPLLLILYASTPLPKGVASFGMVILKLLGMVVLPVLFGQLLRYFFWTKLISKWRLNWGLFPKAVLIFIVYTVFCNTFSTPLNVPYMNFFLIALITVACYVFFMTLSWLCSSNRYLAFTRPDRIAVLFCSTQKTLAMGISMLELMYPGSETLGLLTLPLLIYHPLQLIVGGTIVPSLKRWSLQEEASQPEP